MLNWGTAMEVGHEEFDRDHRQLIAMANLLEDSLQLGDVAQANALAGDLQAKAEDHCRREQALLGTMHGEVARVAAAHCRVGDMAAAVRLAIQAKDTALASRLMAALEESLAQAIDADRRAFASMQSRTAG